MFFQKIYNTIYIDIYSSTPSVELNAGLELITLRSRPEPRSRDRLLTDEATQVLLISFILKEERGYLSRKVYYQEEFRVRDFVDYDQCS